jgi:hypothetical protein
MQYAICKIWLFWQGTAVVPAKSYALRDLCNMTLCIMRISTVVTEEAKPSGDGSGWSGSFECLNPVLTPAKRFSRSGLFAYGFGAQRALHGARCGAIGRDDDVQSIEYCCRNSYTALLILLHHPLPKTGPGRRLGQVSKPASHAVKRRPFQRHKACSEEWVAQAWYSARGHLSLAVNVHIPGIQGSGGR